MPEEKQCTLIESGEWGSQFISDIHKEIELMKTMKSPNLADRWASDDYYWFETSFCILDKGVAAGEPSMLYLAADYKTFASLYYQGEVECGAEKPALDSALNPDLYLLSARKRFPYAMLWCAYCFDKGIHRFGKDALLSRHLLTGISSVPSTIGLSELRFMEQEVNNLVQMAYNADLEEDYITDRYKYNFEEYKDEVPDPQWSTLYLRNFQMVFFMVSMGLPFVLHNPGYNYEWDSNFDLSVSRVKSYKGAWLKWCREQGFDIAGTTDLGDYLRSGPEDIIITDYPRYVLEYILYYDSGEITSPEMHVWLDISGKQYRLKIQLEETRHWFLSVFIKDSGEFNKFSLDYEAASDSHYEFVDEMGIRKAIYKEGDEHLYLHDVFRRFISESGGNALLHRIPVTATFHYD